MERYLAASCTGLSCIVLGCAWSWARAEPNCEYVVVPHAGHMANMDNPQAFNQLLLDFLQRHTAV